MHKGSLSLARQLPSPRVGGDRPGCGQSLPRGVGLPWDALEGRRLVGSWGAFGPVQRGERQGIREGNDLKE